MTARYGYARGAQDEWCVVSPTDQERMLCGRRRGFVPVVQPLFPRFVHEVCRDRWYRDGGPADDEPSEYGICPVCVGEVPVVGGVVVAHGQWRPVEGVLCVSSKPCDGAGLGPEVEQ